MATMKFKHINIAFNDSDQPMQPNCHIGCNYLNFISCMSLKDRIVLSFLMFLTLANSTSPDCCTSM